MNKEELNDIVCQSSSDYEILDNAYYYIEKLEQENKSLQSQLKEKGEVIKEARDYIENTYKDYKNEDGSLPLTLHDQEILEILDKENTNEETN